MAEVKKCCDTCEFNFGGVCAGHGERSDNGKDTYGMSVSDARNMFENGCSDWGISLGAFIISEEAKKGRNALEDEDLVQLIRSSQGLVSECDDGAYEEALRRLEKLSK